MADVPDTLYTLAEDGLSIAYQTVGDGPIDVVLVPLLYAVDVMWEDPRFAYVLRRLARLGRLIVLDFRGFGASDPIPMGGLPTPEAWMDDLRVVLDAVGSAACHLVVHGGGEFIGLLFAATYPERTKTLTLLNPTARITADEDYEIGTQPEALERFLVADCAAWGTPAATRIYAPSRVEDEEYVRWWARYQRAATPRGVHAAYVRWETGLDMRPVLPTIRVPTLLLRRAETLVSRSQSDYLAAHVPAASLIELPGHDFWFFSEPVDDCLDQIESCITGMPAAADPDRALATVMFTDIVSSTEHVARLGDRRWSQLLDQHDDLVSLELERHRGRKVNPTGDGLLAIFD